MSHLQNRLAFLQEAFNLSSDLILYPTEDGSFAGRKSGKYLSAPVHTSTYVTYLCLEGWLLSNICFLLITKASVNALNALKLIIKYYLLE